MRKILGDYSESLFWTLKL